MPIKKSKGFEKSSLANYVITLSGDLDDGKPKHAGTVKAAIFKSFM